MKQNALAEGVSRELETALTRVVEGGLNIEATLAGKSTHTKSAPILNSPKRMKKES